MGNNSEFGIKSRRVKYSPSRIFLSTKGSICDAPKLLYLCISGLIRQVKASFFFF